MKIQRYFLPGDKWIYFKIYCGVQTADEVLSKYISSYVNDLIRNDIIDCFFFIRYTDPENHLRIRFRLVSNKYFNQTIWGLNSLILPSINSSIIWKVQLDMYDREIERYGIYTMDLSESLFYFDSILIVKIIQSYYMFEKDELRWLVAIHQIESLLDLFNYSLKQKINLYNQMEQAYELEFNADKVLRKQINNKYRKDKVKINSFKSDLYYQKAWQAINEFKTSAQKIIPEIIKKHKKHSKLSIDSLLSSYIHMHCNRIFRSKQRIHELVVYSYLHKMAKTKTYVTTETR